MLKIILGSIAKRIILVFLTVLSSLELNFLLKLFRICEFFFQIKFKKGTKIILKSVYQKFSTQRNTVINVNAQIKCCYSQKENQELNEFEEKERKSVLK